MAFITRADNAQFVLQPYREQYLLKDSELLKDELREAAQTNGNFTHIYRQSHQHIEVIFSKVPGYLLGESVWHYFSKPQNLIYCEILSDGTTALFIVVRKNTVLQDTRLAVSQVEQEIKALFSENIPYVFKIYGDLSLSDESVYPIEQLQNPVFQHLPCNDTLKLIDIEQSLEHLKIDNKFSVKWLGGIAAALVVSWLFWLVGPLAYKHHDQLMLLEQSQNVMTQVDVSDQILALVKRVNNVLALPGWILSTAHYEGNEVSIQMQSYGGLAQDILQWANLNHYQIALTGTGVSVTEPIILKARKQPIHYVDIQKTTSKIIDRMMAVLPGKNVSVGNLKQLDDYYEMAVTIDMNDVSTEIIEVIANMLRGLPIALQGVAIHVNNGLLNGKIELTVIGS